MLNFPKVSNLQLHLRTSVWYITQNTQHAYYTSGKKESTAPMNYLATSTSPLRCLCWTDTTVCYVSVLLQTPQPRKTLSTVHTYTCAICLLLLQPHLTIHISGLLQRVHHSDIPDPWMVRFKPGIYSSKRTLWWYKAQWNSMSQNVRVQTVWDSIFWQKHVMRNQAKSISAYLWFLSWII